MMDSMAVNNVIWEDNSVKVSFDKAGSVIVCSNFRFSVQGHHAAILELIPSSDLCNLPLDLRVRVVRQQVVENVDTICHTYFYDGINCQTVLSFVSTLQGEERDRSINALEFILGQYTIFSFEEVALSRNEQSPNIVAKGFEGLGVGFRVALRSGGRTTGSAIRYLGEKYTTATIGDGIDRGNRVAEQIQIDNAEAHKARAETCHAGARTVTSAALVPVRWIGKSASRIAPKGSTNPSGVEKIVQDTLGGVGNGVANILKVILCAALLCSIVRVSSSYSRDVVSFT